MMFKFIRRWLGQEGSQARGRSDSILPVPAAPGLHPAKCKGIMLIDVREHSELALAQIDGAVHIPAGELVNRAGELDKSLEIVTFDHFGMRSEWAAEQLLFLGFEKVRFMKGGIDAWSREVDPSVPRY
ncbi:MAG: rhodanese-like domain-containing protein [Planctomycetota bacterium]|nr:rhodanese-like domain-containing protein [Planctomycetota bacterium]